MSPGSRWKNRFISTKFYDKEVSVSIIGQKNKTTDKNESNEGEFKVKIRRAVDLHFLANVLFCSSCKTALPLDSINKEYLKELDSIVSRRCQKCILFKTVLTWKTHTSEFSETLIEPSFIGTLNECWPHDALNHSSVEKCLRTMKVPYMTSYTYKKYGKEVEPIIETAMTESYKRMI